MGSGSLLKSLLFPKAVDKKQFEGSLLRAVYNKKVIRKFLDIVGREKDHIIVLTNCLLLKRESVFFKFSYNELGMWCKVFDSLESIPGFSDICKLLRSSHQIYDLLFELKCASFFKNSSNQNQVYLQVAKNPNRCSRVFDFQVQQNSLTVYCECKNIKKNGGRGLRKIIKKKVRAALSQLPPVGTKIVLLNLNVASATNTHCRSIVKNSKTDSLILGIPENDGFRFFYKNKNYTEIMSLLNLRKYGV